MSRYVTSTHDNGIAVLTIDHPPVNALNAAVLEELVEGVRDAERVSGIAAVVVIGAGRTFIAGADIREFPKIASGEKEWVSLTPGLLTIEDCSKPVVMAIHGTAFGGGLETAMAGHYRVATADAQVGQPEVKLGLIPGAGGTQRLPRLAGVAKAAEMCALGEPIGAREAFEFGIVDRVVEGELLAGALAFARDVAGVVPPRSRARGDRMGDEPINLEILAEARKLAQLRRPEETAPQLAIDAIGAATKLPFEEGCALEEELFVQCLASRQSAALIHVFFGERDVKKRGVDLAGIAGRLGAGSLEELAVRGRALMAEEPAVQAVDIDLASIQLLGVAAWTGGAMWAAGVTR